MKRRTRFALAILGVVALAGVVWLFTRPGSRRPEPVYQGRLLSSWLTAFDPANTNPSVPSVRDARRAVRQAGTNAIPILLRMLRASDSPLKLKIMALTGKQHLVNFRFTPASTFYLEAETAFEILGPRASNAVPELIQMFDQDPPLGSQRRIAYLFRSLGPASKAAIPDLQRVAANTNNPAWGDASNGLANLNPNPFSRELPTTAYRLGDPDDKGRVLAAMSLWQFRELGLYQDAPTVIPTLLELLNKPGLNTYWAGFVLEELDPDIAARFPGNKNQTTEPRLSPSVDSLVSDHPDAGDTAGANLLAVGKWSEPMLEQPEYTVRGRLLVYAGTHYANRTGEWWGSAPVYLELQNAGLFTGLPPPTVHIDFKESIRYELRDAQGRPVPSDSAQPGAIPRSIWITIPSDGTVKFRVDSPSSASHARGDNLVIQLGSGTWHIPAGDTNVYYLSGTFTSTTNQPNPLDYHVWLGTLNLPPVKISVPKP